jgi:predicted membrane-bound spermidine synthase
MKTLARVPGRFGGIRVFERSIDGARLYCIDGSVHTMCRPDGTSLFGYVHAIKKLVRDANEVLVVGGAGASMATMLSRRGAGVTVIDVDPAAEKLARQHFGLPAEVAWINDDAFVHLARSAKWFDAIIMDACDADGTVAASTSADHLARLMDHVREDGLLAVNLAGPDGAPAQSWDLACALSAMGFESILLRPEEGWEGNEILLISHLPQSPHLDLSDLHERPAETRTYLMSLRAYTAPPYRRAVKEEL